MNIVLIQCTEKKGTRKHIITISAADYINLIDKVYIVLCVMYAAYIITF